MFEIDKDQRIAELEQTLAALQNLLEECDWPLEHAAIYSNGPETEAAIQDLRKRIKDALAKK